MIVVADTSPLNYLVLIRAIDVLPALFGEVHTPTAVIGELRDPRAPEPVRTWARAVPNWLRVADARSILPSVSRLHPGEAAAISLAAEIRATALLIDERRGRRVAEREGLVVLPTVAVLEYAAERKLIELPAAFSSLLKTSFGFPGNRSTRRWQETRDGRAKVLDGQWRLSLPLLGQNYGRALPHWPERRLRRTRRVCC